MLRCLAIFACLALIAAQPFDSLRGSDGDNTTLAFIGTVDFVREGERDRAWYDAKARLYDPTGETIIVSTGGQGWSVRLRPTDILRDAKNTLKPDAIVDAWASSHYGLPTFALRDDAEWLFMVTDDPDGWVVRLSLPVGRTAGGDAYTCGSLFEGDTQRDGDPPIPTLRPVAFVPPLSFDVDAEAVARGRRSDDTEEELAERIEVLRDRYAKRGWTVSEGTATCERGISAERTVDYYARTSLRWSAVERHCIEQQAHLSGTPGYEPDIGNIDLGRWNSEKVRACTDNLYHAGWPYTE